LVAAAVFCVAARLGKVVWRLYLDIRLREARKQLPFATMKVESSS